MESNETTWSNSGKTRDRGGDAAVKTLEHESDETVSKTVKRKHQSQSQQTRRILKRVAGEASKGSDQGMITQVSFAAMKAAEDKQQHQADYSSSASSDSQQPRQPTAQDQLPQKLMAMGGLSAVLLMQQLQQEQQQQQLASCIGPWQMGGSSAPAWATQAGQVRTTTSGANIPNFLASTSLDHVAMAHVHHAQSATSASSPVMPTMVSHHHAPSHQRFNGQSSLGQQLLDLTKGHGRGHGHGHGLHSLLQPQPSSSVAQAMQHKSVAQAQNLLQLLSLQVSGGKSGMSGRGYHEGIELVEQQQQQQLVHLQQAISLLQQQQQQQEVQTVVGSVPVDMASTLMSLLQQQEQEQQQEQQQRAFLQTIQQAMQQTSRGNDTVKNHTVSSNSQFRNGNDISLGLHSGGLSDLRGLSSLAGGGLGMSMKLDEEEGRRLKRRAQNREAQRRHRLKTRDMAMTAPGSSSGGSGTPSEGIPAAPAQQEWSNQGQSARGGSVAMPGPTTLCLSRSSNGTVS